LPDARRQWFKAKTSEALAGIKKMHNLFEVEGCAVGSPKVASELATLGFVAEPL
jgi:hypothetical protein